MTPLFLASEPLSVGSSHAWVATPTVAATAPVLTVSMPSYRGAAA